MSNSTSSDDIEASRYPFGLSSKAFFVLVVIVGLIGPGLLVYTIEQANLSGVADLVWIIGYGTTVFVVWFVWLRPVDFLGQAAQDPSSDSKAEAEDNTGGTDSASQRSSREDAESHEESKPGDGSETDEQTGGSSVTKSEFPRESPPKEG